GHIVKRRPVFPNSRLIGSLRVIKVRGGFQKSLVILYIIAVSALDGGDEERKGNIPVHQAIGDAEPVAGLLIANDRPVSPRSNLPVAILVNQLILPGIKTLRYFSIK